jgi:PAS domain S-box-containing protein
MTSNPDTPTLLIVDDTPGNLSVVVDLFESSGHRVAIAIDGEEGLQRAQWVLPDLILLDVMLPDVDGFEVCRRLKADDRTRDIPVLFMTSLASTEHKVKGFEAGGVDYLTKPLQIDEVMARVGTHLKLHAAQRDLAVRNAQLDAYGRELERRVEERTAQLSASNRQLREEIERRRAVEERLALIGFAFDHVHEAAYLVDEAACIHYVNQEACRRLGYTQDELIGRRVADVDHDWPEKRWPEHWREVRAHGSLTFESQHRRRDGTVFPVEINANHFEYGGRAYNLGLARDISERKRAEQTQQKLARALDLLSQSNAALLYAETEQDLLAEICKLAVDVGGYRMAWVGFAEHDAARSVRPVAQSGFEADYLDTLNISWADTEHGRGPTGSAIRTGATVVNHDSLNNPAMAPWREASIQHAFQSSIAIPLARNHRTLGALTIYSAEAFAFGREEIALLEELANNVAYGIETLRLAVEREHMAAELRERELRYRGIFDHVLDTLYLLEVTPDGRFRNLEVNPAFEKSSGMPSAALIGKFIDETVPEETARIVSAKYRRCIEAGTAIDEEVALDLPSGRRHYHSTLVPVSDGSGRIHRIVGISRDITERKQMEEALAQREREFRTLAENLPDNLIRYNLEGQAVYINRTFRENVALDPDRLLGRTHTEAYPDVDVSRTYQATLERVIATGEPARIEILVPNRAGQMRNHQISFVAERQPNGDIRGALAIGRDVTALLETERRLAESHARLRELLAQRETDREEERRRIAREMHDELGQVLTALKLGISMLKMQFGRDQPALAERIRGLLELADKSIRTVRSVATSLRPTALEMGIFPALQWLTGEFERHSGVSCRLSLPDCQGQVDEARAMALFRAVQEALTNVARYAGAGRVEVELKCAPDGACLLEIRDNGEGFDPATAKNGFGLLGMRERIDSLGGELTLDSAPGAGTRIAIRIPIQPDGDEDSA